MTTRSIRLVVWAARLLGAATCVFIGLFALDAFSAGKPFSVAGVDFAVHLIPSVVLLAIVALSWRWPWVGGVAFLLLGTLYVITMSRGRLDWITVISGPLFLVGTLFLWSWYCQRGVRNPM